MNKRKYAYRIALIVISALVAVWAIRAFLIMQVRVSDDTQAPYLITGDHLLVSRLSYGLRLPIDNRHGRPIRIGSSTPLRGTLACFNSPTPDSLGIASRHVFVATITALPGDTVWVDTLTTSVAHEPHHGLLPLPVPSRGRAIAVTPANMGIITQTLRMHEGVDSMTIRDGKLYIAHDRADSVRFSQDYYWVSAGHKEKGIDSQTFGFLPHSHLIGRPLIISYSTDPTAPWYAPLRTDRTMKSIN